MKVLMTTCCMSQMPVRRLVHLLCRAPGGHPQPEAALQDLAEHLLPAGHRGAGRRALRHRVPGTSCSGFCTQVCKSFSKALL